MSLLPKPGVPPRGRTRPRTGLPPGHLRRLRGRPRARCPQPRKVAGPLKGRLRARPWGRLRARPRGLLRAWPGGPRRGPPRYLPFLTSPRSPEDGLLSPTLFRLTLPLARLRPARLPSWPRRRRSPKRPSARGSAVRGASATSRPWPCPKGRRHKSGLCQTGMHQTGTCQTGLCPGDGHQAEGGFPLKPKVGPLKPKVGPLKLISRPRRKSRRATAPGGRSPRGPPRLWAPARWWSGRRQLPASPSNPPRGRSAGAVPAVRDARPGAEHFRRAF